MWIIDTLSPLLFLFNLSQNFKQQKAGDVVILMGFTQTKIPLRSIQHNFPYKSGRVKTGPIYFFSKNVSVLLLSPSATFCWIIFVARFKAWTDMLSKHPSIVLMSTFLFLNYFVLVIAFSMIDWYLRQKKVMRMKRVQNTVLSIIAHV